LADIAELSSELQRTHFCAPFGNAENRDLAEMIRSRVSAVLLKPGPEFARRAYLVKSQLKR